MENKKIMLSNGVNACYYVLEFNEGGVYLYVGGALKFHASRQQLSETLDAIFDIEKTLYPKPDDISELSDVVKMIEGLSDELIRARMVKIPEDLFLKFKREMLRALVLRDPEASYSLRVSSAVNGMRELVTGGISKLMNELNSRPTTEVSEFGKDLDFVARYVTGRDKFPIT